MRGDASHTRVRDDAMHGASSAATALPQDAWSSTWLFVFWVLPISLLGVVVRQVEHTVLFVNYHSAVYATMGICALIIACLYARRPFNGIGGAAGDVLSGLSQELALVFLLLADAVAEPFCLVAACLLAGFGAALGAIRWGAVLSGLRTETLIICVFVGQIISAFAVSVLGSNHSLASVAVLATMPVVSIAAIRRCRRVPQARREQRYTPEMYKGFIGMACGIALYGAMLGFRTYLGYGTFIRPSGIESVAVQAALVVGAFALVRSISRTGIEDPSRLFGVLMVAFAVCFVAIPIAPARVAALLDSCVSGLVIIVISLLAMVGAYVVRMSAIHPYTVFGCIYALYGVPRLVSSAFMAGLSNVAYLDGGANSMVQAMILMLVVAAVSLMHLSPGMPRLLDDLAPVPISQTGKNGHEQNISAVARRYGLTDREVEVMRLISRGRSKAFIAEALCISENTVKTHWKALYEKLGVHSKQEMLDLIEKAE